jgi:NAD(P)-dependent dehydrogenase (short-subunit alcohol dehydrogenase family)
MNGWNGKIAIVTGAASGIGLALSRAMNRRGAIVWMTDIDTAGVEKAAKSLGAAAHAATLDVRDAAAVKALVDRVVAGHGRIDLLFNNAGIGVGGPAEELTNAHYDRAIDVNIRGVVHGITAAYPHMMKQQSGYIVNTASMAGLTPTPLLAPYGMTKHAVVGLSTSIRIEAARYGVGVSALCPSVIETPILDTKNPADLPALSWMPDARSFLTRFAGKPYPVEKLAEYTLDSIEKNRALIIVPAFARYMHRMYRFLPGLVMRGLERTVNTVYAERIGMGGGGT